MSAYSVGPPKVHNSPEESAVCSVSDNAEARDIREFIFFLGAFRASITAIRFCIRFVKVDFWQLKVTDPLKVLNENC